MGEIRFIWPRALSGGLAAGRKLSILFAVLIFLLAMPATPGLAQEKVEVLEEIAVTASRSAARVFDTPQSVTVITEKEIQASPFERVEDIVRQAAGIYNFRHFTLHTNGIVSPLRMRGVGNNRVLLLVDGVPQNDNFNNAIAWVSWGYIPKDAIQRIEIVRGPMSAMYGSEGLGGVINIITKNPKTQREAKLTGKVGRGDTGGGDLLFAQKVKNAGLLIAGGYETSQGFYLDEPKQDYHVRRYGEMGRIFGKACYDFTPRSHLTFSGQFYTHDQGQGRPFFHSELSLDQYSLTYAHKWDKVHLQGLAFLNRAHKTAFQDKAGDNYQSLFRIERMREPSVWGLDLQTTLLPLDWLTTTMGVTYKRVSWTYDEKYPASWRLGGAEGQQSFISPFINADLRLFGGKLVANAGARYDWIACFNGKNWDTQPEGGLTPFDNSYDTTRWRNFSPRGGLAFHPDSRTTIRASAGTGFRAPSLFELYKVHVRGGGKYFRFANPDLQPEKITSYDLGLERFFTDSLWARATFYQSFARDYIGDRLLRSYQKKQKKKLVTFNEYKLENISRVNIHGLETEVEWHLRKDLTLFANYTYNISKIAEDLENPGLEGKYVTTDPIHKIHFGLWYQNPQLLNVYLLGNYYLNIYYDTENTYKTGGYFTLDFSLSRQFFNHATLILEVENLFNRKYPLFISVDGTTIVPGRLIMGKLALNF